MILPHIALPTARKVYPATSLLLLLAVLLHGKVFATNYYMSNAGSDGAPGTSSSAPWQTITRLNMVSYVPGDTVFFRCGDTFRGDIIVNQGGNATSRLVFTSYSTGAMPIINGAELVTGWTPSGSYYQAPYTGTVVNFFVNGAEQTLARYPNEHNYLTLDSAQTLYLKDASLSSVSPTYITGSKVCVHSSQWSWEKASVSAYAANKITYSAPMIAAIDKYGYFLFDNITLLDTAMEWKYDATAHIMYYKPPSSITPSTATCEASVYQNGIEFGSAVSYVSVTGLAFCKQANAGIKTTGTGNQKLVVSNCYFQGQYNYGINLTDAHCRITNTTFRDVDGMAIFINGTGANADTVDHVTFRNIGVTRASGLGGQINGTALMCASDSNYLHHNNVDSTGYCGISADGKANIIERNIIDHAMLIEIDGAGLKGWGSITVSSIYRNNFINHSDGNPEGCFNPSFITPAIYFDFNVNNCNISNNTVYNHTKKGIFQNSSNYNNTITDNVVYGGSCLIDMNGSNLAPGPVPITGMHITRNSFFCRDTAGYVIREVDYSGTFSMGVIDSNYYFQPYNHRYALRMIGMAPTYYSFTGWQATGNDAHTDSSYLSWTYPVDSSQLFMNQTDTVATITLGGIQYRDLAGNIVCGPIILQPYTSVILIRTSTTCTFTTYTQPLLESQTVSLYPNPTTGNITISGAAHTLPARYDVYNLTGSKVLSGTLTNLPESIPTANLTPGMYIFVTGGDLPTKIKFVKE